MFHIFTGCSFVRQFPVLHFPPPAMLSVIFLSCIFQPCTFVRRFPVLQFPPPEISLSVIFLSCKFSAPFNNRSDVICSIKVYFALFWEGTYPYRGPTSSSLLHWLQRIITVYSPGVFKFWRFARDRTKPLPLNPTGGLPKSPFCPLHGGRVTSLGYFLHATHCVVHQI